MNEKWFVKKDSRIGIWLPVKLVLDREAEADIILAAIAAVKIHDSEISGLGKISENQGVFNSAEVFVPEQTSSSGRTKFDGAEIEGFYENLKLSGRDPSLWQLWWHTHGTMSVFYSGTDEKTIQARLEALLNDEHAAIMSKRGRVPDQTAAGPFVALVANAYGEMTAKCFFIVRNEDASRKNFEFLSADLPMERRFKPPLNSLPEEDFDFLVKRYNGVAELVRAKITPKRCRR